MRKKKRIMNATGSSIRQINCFAFSGATLDTSRSMAVITVPTRIQTILLVEDEPFFTRVCERALIKKNRVIKTASRADEVLNIIDESHPDLLILDLLLEGGDSFSILESLKEHHQTIPVIILSNLGRDAYGNLRKHPGVIDYWIKSELSLEDLARKVDHYLKPAP